MRHLVLFLVCLLGAFLVACQDDVTPEDVNPLSCTPGETRACVCTNGLDGAQACSDDGNRFDICVCDTTPSPDPEPDANPDMEPGMVPDPAPDTDPNPEPTPEPDANPEPTPEPDANPEPEPGMDPEPDADPEPTMEPDMMGARECTEQSDCEEPMACPMGSIGCQCNQTPRGMSCVPTCETDADCPEVMNTLVCRMGLCRRQMN